MADWMEYKKVALLVELLAEKLVVLMVEEKDCQ
jgi:hypothetical protein